MYESEWEVIGTSQGKDSTWSNGRHRIVRRARSGGDVYVLTFADGHYMEADSLPYAKHLAAEHGEAHSKSNYADNLVVGAGSLDAHASVADPLSPREYASRFPEQES